MDEARAVLARLERIEALDRRDADPARLLSELRALLREVEAWARSEDGRAEGARRAVDRLNLALRDTSRSLVA